MLNAVKLKAPGVRLSHLPHESSVTTTIIINLHLLTIDLYFGNRQKQKQEKLWIKEMLL